MKGIIRNSVKMCGRVNKPGEKYSDHITRKYTISLSEISCQSFDISQIDGYKIQNALSFDGTKYLDTGYKPTNNTRVEIGFNLVALGGFVYGSCSGKAIPPLTNNSTISKTTITFGDTIVLQAYASGGMPPYQYTFLCMHHTETKWTTLTSYGTTSRRVWQPKKSGTYIVRSKIKDTTGEEVIKDFTLTVNETTETSSDTAQAESVILSESIVSDESTTSDECNDAHAVYLSDDYTVYRFGSISNYVDILRNTDIYQLKVSQDGAYENDSAMCYFDDADFISDYDLYIGACNEAGSANIYKFTGDIYYFRIYENNVLKMDLLPCTCIYDNVSGMYDFVNYKFYPIISESEE